MDPKIKNILITSLLFLLIILLNVLVILKEILKPFYRFIFARKQPLFLRTPEDRFKGDLFLLCQKNLNSRIRKTNTYSKVSIKRPVLLNDLV